MKSKTTPRQTAPSSSSSSISRRRGSGDGAKDLSPFREVDVVLKCALLPSQIEFPLDGVKYQLNEMLFRYNYDLQGIPVSYSQIVFEKGKDCGRIMGEMPSVHIDISTKLMVFQPTIGQQLFGKITKMSEGHVALLIHGMFNASIRGDEMSKKYTYNHDSLTWEHPKADLNEGDMMLFTYKDSSNVRGVFNIEGAVI